LPAAALITGDGAEDSPVIVPRALRRRIALADVKMRGEQPFFQGISRRESFAAPMRGDWMPDSMPATVRRDTCRLEGIPLVAPQGDLRLGKEPIWARARNNRPQI
jgi:hypothetical protein